MNLESRIAAVMAEWADAGDDVPEELKIIRELRQREAKLRQLCNDALAVLNAHAVGYRTQEALEAAIVEVEGK